MKTNRRCLSPWAWVFCAALGCGGGGNGETGTVETPLDLEPVVLSAAALGPSAVRLTWTDAADATAFAVERSEDENVFAEIVTVDKGALVFDDVGVEDTRAHHYRIRVLVAGGEARVSNVATVDTPASRWTVHATSSAPPARAGHTAILDTIGNRMIVYGGWGGYVYRSDAWALDLTTLEWRELKSEAPEPLGREQHSAVFDPSKNRMVIYGGYNRQSDEAFEDVWALNLETEEWQRLSESSPPGQRYGHSAIRDSGSRNRMLVYGGARGVVVSDLWSFDLDSDRWELLSDGLADLGPEPRAVHAATVDESRRRMIVTGGRSSHPTFHTNSRVSEQVWAYDLDTAEWTRVQTTLESSEASDEGRTEHASIVDAARRRLVLIGGSLFLGGMAPNFGSPLVLSMDSGEWKPLIPAPGVSPSSRLLHSAVFDPRTRRMIVFGGMFEDGSFTNELWVLDL